MNCIANRRMLFARLRFRTGKANRLSVPIDVPGGVLKELWTYAEVDLHPNTLDRRGKNESYKSRKHANRRHRIFLKAFRWDRQIRSDKFNFLLGA